MYMSLFARLNFHKDRLLITLKIPTCLHVFCAYTAHKCALLSCKKLGWKKNKFPFLA